MENGTKVRLNGRQGTVQKSFDHAVTLEVGGAEATSEGTPADPALLIKMSDGTQDLALSSEVAITQDTLRALGPKVADGGPGAGEKHNVQPRPREQRGRPDPKTDTQNPKLR